MLCPGVVVGAGAIVTAGSVVTKDLPDMEVHAGNPAQFVKHRDLRTR
jgi:acetyltransferase-like isoleucine patch superfamily enzyme